MLAIETRERRVMTDETEGRIETIGCDKRAAFVLEVATFRSKGQRAIIGSCCFLTLSTLFDANRRIKRLIFICKLTLPQLSALLFSVVSVLLGGAPLSAPRAWFHAGTTS